MDTQELAARALGALVPHLGHLATHATERLTDAAADHLYRLVKSRLSADRDSNTALARLQEQPQDAQRRATVEAALPRPSLPIPSLPKHSPKRLAGSSHRWEPLSISSAQRLDSLAQPSQVSL